MKRTKILLLGALGALGVLCGCNSSGMSSPDWRTTADVLTFTATSRVVSYPYLTTHPPAVEVTVVIANDNSQTIPFNYSRCGQLGLRAFATQNLSGSPLWETDNSHVECSAIGYGLTHLAPGQSIEVTLYSLVSSILGSDKPSGSYYMEAYIGVGGGYIRPSSVNVPAGFVQLSK